MTWHQSSSWLIDRVAIHSSAVRSTVAKGVVSALTLAASLTEAHCFAGTIARSNAGNLAPNYVSKAKSSAGRWVFTPENGGAKLGWTSGGANEELNGIVFICSKNSYSIEINLDLGPNSKTGKRTNIIVSGAYTHLRGSSEIQDGMNGPNVSIFSQPPSIFNLLNERSNISIKSSFDDVVSYPPSADAFTKFIIKCGGKVTVSKWDVHNGDLLRGEAQEAAGGPAATPFVGRWHYVGARYFDFQKDGVFLDRFGGEAPRTGTWRLTSDRGLLIQEGRGGIMRCAYQISGNRASLAFCPLNGLMDKVKP